MSRYTRGEFFGIGAVLAGAFTLDRLSGVSHTVAAASQTPQSATSAGSVAAEPDLIVVNGNVLTSDTALPRAEAFAVKHGRFVAVGSNADIRHLATRRTQVIDAQRMTVTPGFIDTHCHASGVNVLYGVNTNLRTVREVQAAIKQKAANTPPGFWVTGFLFDDTKLDRPLTRKDPEHQGESDGRGWNDGPRLGCGGAALRWLSDEEGLERAGAVNLHDGLSGGPAEVANLLRHHAVCA